MPTASPPLLYHPDGVQPVLIGSRCGRCQLVSFPRQTIGCESCGAHEDSISQIDLAAEGVVHSHATVYRHASSPVPFGIVEVRLDDGPLIRALLDLHQPVTTGDRVRASWSVPTDPESDHTPEPVFGVIR